MAIVNFKTKQIANFFSECLVLGIEDKNKQIVLLQASKSIKNGEQVTEIIEESVDPRTG